MILGQLFLFCFILSMAFSFVGGIAAAFLGGGLHQETAFLVLLVAVFSALCLTFWRSSFFKGRESVVSISSSCSRLIRPRLSFWEWGVVLSFLLVVFRSFFWLFYNDGDQLKVLSPYNLGDMSWHITLIHYLARVTHWWPANPILVGEPLRYQIGTDFINALLTLVGVPLQQGLLWIGLLGAAATLVALWRWGGAFAVATLLFTGGLGGYDLIRGIPAYTVEQQLMWKNLFLTLFVTQRSFLFALPAGLWLLTRWRELSVNSLSGEEERLDNSIKSSFSFQMILLEGFLLGVIPAFSAHSFLFLMVTLGCLILLCSESKQHFLLVAFLGGVAGFLMTKLVAPGGVTPGLIGWQVGWMEQGHTLVEVGWFWLKNFGIGLPLILLLFLLVCRSRGKRKRVARPFVVAAVLLFLSCCFIRWVPWAWDNTKLMLWSYLAVAPFLWELLLKPAPRVIRILLFFFLFSSGAATLFLELGFFAPHQHAANSLELSSEQQGYQIGSLEELRVVKGMLRDLPSGALPPGGVIATVPTYNHPLSLLGYPIAVGYEGHLWSHGLNYKDRLEQLRSIMQGEPGWEQKAHKLGVSAIFWGKEEEEAFPQSQLPFAHQSTNLGKEGKVKPCFYWISDSAK